MQHTQHLINIATDTGIDWNVFSSNIFELVQNCHLCLFLSALSTLLPPEVVLLPTFVKSYQCCHAAYKHQRHTYTHKHTHTHKANVCSSTDKHAHKHKNKSYLRRVSARSSDSFRLSGLLCSKEVSYLF